jgi:hypothetical protein
MYDVRRLRGDKAPRKNTRKNIDIASFLSIYL